MWGKFYECAFTGSMMGAGAEVFALWAWVIANTRSSRVEINTKLVSVFIGMSEDQVVKAVEYLCQPDPKSRNPEHEGRRLVPEDGITYYVPSWQHYHDLANEDDRRAYFREAKRRERQRKEKPDPPPKDEQYLTEARVLIAYLNETAARSYRETDNNLSRIRARLAEVHGDVAGCKKMIARQVARWSKDPKMFEYLRVETLFGKEKFSNYYDNRDLPVETSAAMPTPARLGRPAPDLKLPFIKVPTTNP